MMAISCSILKCQACIQLNSWRPIALLLLIELLRTVHAERLFYTTCMGRECKKFACLLECTRAFVELRQYHDKVEDGPPW